MTTSPRRLVLLAILTVLGFAAPAAADFRRNLPDGVRPRLAVVVSLDLFRADYLRRWPDLLLPARDVQGRVGGFRWLTTEGTWFADSRFTHVPNETGPGHAVLLTGADPYATGIVGNDWIDPATGKGVYCVEDPRGTIVGLPPGRTLPPIGPVNLRVSTVGDELEMATSGRSRTVSIAVKDRAAVLMAGHAADLVLWLDTGDLRWISSRAYLPSGVLPSWLSAEDVLAPLKSPAGRTWEPLPETVRAERDGRARSIHLPGWKGPLGMGANFPHRIEEGNDTGKEFLRTPFANDAVLSAARRAVTELGLGKDEVPDLLTIGLSANDWIGHAWGPYAPETLDAFLRADRALSDFLRFVESEVPGGLASVVVVVSSDHGIATPPEELAAHGIDARRVLSERIENAAEAALREAFGEGPWLLKAVDGGNAFFEPYLWFAPEALAKAPSRAAAEEVATRGVARVPGVYAAFGRTAVVEGRLPDTPIGRAVSRGFHPARSGDLVVVMEPFAMSDLVEESAGEEAAYPANHSQAWSYDSEVPVLIGGFGLPAGVRTDRVGPASIAPTLSLLLGVARPSGSDAPILFF
jgi:hypothetical protein